ncbi:DNA polymerase processivity subunit [Spheniscid alphaherpesvirus 1]|uniref:DNA polymerase processivity factor n=1 Tax=Spheniscid alphaherpesvirus 1 TaxID=2560777 RepID=A0A1R3TCG1_9ALPH|nr:DNA polymerase processivity subunit [Spheniscid alphaherpesvirus 1]
MALLGRDESDFCAEMENCTSFALLKESDLMDVMAVLSPLSGNLKNALLIFGEDGMLIHAGADGEQIYVPVTFVNFTQYQWSGPHAVFLANVDGHKSLLDAFRHGKKTMPSEVRFEFTGKSPARVLTQVTTFKSSESCNESCFSATMIKRELASYSTCIPRQPADVYVTLTKGQMSKVLNATKATTKSPVFEFDSTTKRLTVASTCGSVTFVVDGLTCEQNDADRYSQQQYEKSTKVMEAVLKRGSGRKQDNMQVSGIGTATSFRLSIESYMCFKSLIQKTRGYAPITTVAFHLNKDAPMISVSIGETYRTTMYFFCTYDCPSVSEIEDIAASINTQAETKRTQKRRASEVLEGEPGKKRLPKDSVKLKRARQSIGKVMDLCSYLSQNTTELASSSEAEELRQLVERMTENGRKLCDALDAESCTKD